VPDPNDNKIMMLKFEGKNRSYKISNLLGKEETLEKNEKYLTLPIIVTNEFLRIYRVSIINEKDSYFYDEFKKELEPELTYEIFFENKIKLILESVKIVIIKLIKHI